MNAEVGATNETKRYKIARTYTQAGREQTHNKKGGLDQRVCTSERSNDSHTEGTSRRWLGHGQEIEARFEGFFVELWRRIKGE